MERLDHTNLDFERLAEMCSPFVQDLVMYVITNMHEELESFLKEHCRGVDDDEELHKHRYWDMFQDYSELLEGKLSIFVDKHNMTAHTFYDQLQEAQTTDPMASQIIQYLLGATEYRRFVDLLIDRKMFHFGMGGPIGAAVGADGSVVGATSSNEGKQSGGSGGSGGGERGSSSGSSKSNSDGQDSDRSFSRKVSDEAMVTSSGSGSGSGSGGGGGGGGGSSSGGSGGGSSGSGSGDVGGKDNENSPASRKK